MNELTRVYVEGDSSNDNTTEITPEYVYISIPANYICLYNKLLVMMANYGIDMLKDCNADCSGKNKSIIKCFNMFNAAIAAYKLEQTKLAETIIKYIDATIKQFNIDSESSILRYSVTSDNSIEAIVTCSNPPKFEIDVENGSLWEDINSGENNGVFIVNEGDLDMT